MSMFGDSTFFIWAALLLIPAVILGIMEKPIKYYGFLLSLFFIGAACINSPVSLVYMGLYCIWQYGLARVMLKVTKKSGRDRRAFWAAISLSILPLAVFKLSGLIGHSLFGFIGISYLTFKSVQIIIEIYDEIIKECRPFEFAYFLLFFPSVSAGPIDRSRRFEEDIRRIPPKKEYLDMVGTGLFKICLGLVYKFVIAALLYQGITYIAYVDIVSRFWVQLGYMYLYGGYLFFDFAGYSLMAIGVSYMLGVKTPENFNKPFISTDIREFWDRWHITLSHWFRDFVFSRFMMASIRGKWFSSKLTGAACGFMINMTLMGIWHGLDMSYIIYGVYHGILLSITEMYQKKSKFYKKNKKKKWYIWISRVITFNLVMFGFYIFSGRLMEII